MADKQTLGSDDWQRRAWGDAQRTANSTRPQPEPKQNAVDADEATDAIVAGNSTATKYETPERPQAL